MSKLHNYWTGWDTFDMAQKFANFWARLRFGILYIACQMLGAGQKSTWNCETINQHQPTSTNINQVKSSQLVTPPRLEGNMDFPQSLANKTNGWCWPMLFPVWYAAHLWPSGFRPGSDLFGNSQALGGNISFKSVYEGFNNAVVELSKTMFLLSHSCLLQCKSNKHLNLKQTFQHSNFYNSCLISKVSISNITTPLLRTILRNPTERNSRNLAFATLALTLLAWFQRTLLRVGCKIKRQKRSNVDIAPLHHVAHRFPRLIFQWPLTMAKIASPDIPQILSNPSSKNVWNSLAKMCSEVIVAWKSCTPSIFTIEIS